MIVAKTNSARSFLQRNLTNACLQLNPHVTLHLFAPLLNTLVPFGHHIINKCTEIRNGAAAGCQICVK